MFPDLAASRRSRSRPAVPRAGRRPGLAPPRRALSIAAIMAQDWIGTPPEDPYWSDDSKSIYFRQRRAGSDVVDLYRTEMASGHTERVPVAELGGADGPGRLLVARPQAQGLHPRGRPLRGRARPTVRAPADAHLRRRERTARAGDRQERRLPARRCLPRDRSRERTRLDARRPPDREGSERACPTARAFSSVSNCGCSRCSPRASSARTSWQEAIALPVPPIRRARRRRSSSARKRRIQSAELSPSGHTCWWLSDPPFRRGGRGGRGGRSEVAESGKEDSLPVFVTESGYVGGPFAEQCFRQENLD